MSEHPSLNPQQEAFCQHYVLEPNATQAALHAGYSEGSLRNQGYRLLRNPAVQARIAELRADIGRRHCLDIGAIAAKLENVYTTALDGTFYNAAVQALALQVRIAGLVAGQAGDPAGRATAAPEPAGADRPSAAPGRTPADGTALARGDGMTT